MCPEIKMWKKEASTMKKMQMIIDQSYKWFFNFVPLKFGLHQKDYINSLALNVFFSTK